MRVRRRWNETVFLRRRPCFGDWWRGTAIASWRQWTAFAVLQGGEAPVPPRALIGGKKCCQSAPTRPLAPRSGNGAEGRGKKYRNGPISILTCDRSTPGARQSHLSGSGLFVPFERSRNSRPPCAHAPIPPHLPGIFPAIGGCGAAFARRSVQHAIALIPGVPSCNPRPPSSFY